MVSLQVPRAQAGTSLIEVLVTIVILAIGLLGLAGLQSRLQVSEMESYQRAQALVLLNDMVGRIEANRTNAASYVTGAGSRWEWAWFAQQVLRHRRMSMLVSGAMHFREQPKPWAEATSAPCWAGGAASKAWGRVSISSPWHGRA
jgi:type IV pilus modification protein PilV